MSNTTALKLVHSDEPQHRGHSVLWERLEWLRLLVQHGGYARLTPAAQAVMLVVFSHLNDRWVAWPSAQTIAQEAGIGLRTAKRGRRELIDAGLLEQVDEGGGRRSGSYRIKRSGWESTDRDGPEPLALSNSADAPVTPQGGRLCHPSGVSGAPLTRVIEQEALNNVVDDVGDSAQGGECAPEPRGEQFGLFEDLEAVNLLVDRTFNARDARRLVRDYGSARVREAVANTDHLKDHGEIRKGYRPAAVSFLRHDQALDERLVSQKRGAKSAELAAERDRERRADEAKMQRDVEAVRKADLELIRSLSVDQVEAYRQKVLQGMEPMLQRMNARQPATSMWLLSHVATLAREAPS